MEPGGGTCHAARVGPVRKIERRGEDRSMGYFIPSNARGFGHLNSFRVPPETLERIEVTSLWREDMDDETEEVHENPLGTVVPFNVGRPDSRGPQRLFNGVRDRLHLALTAAGTEYEEIGERRSAA